MWGWYRAGKHVRSGSSKKFVDFAVPKSVSLMWPVAEIIKLSGLRSRCTMSNSWMYSTAEKVARHPPPQKKWDE